MGLPKSAENMEFFHICFFSSVFGYFIQTILKGIGLKAILLIKSLLPKNIHKTCQYYQEWGSIYQSQTGHICVSTSCPKDTKAGVARETAEEGVDACTDSSAADVGGTGTDTFSTLLCPRMGEN